MKRTVFVLSLFALPMLADHDNHNNCAGLPTAAQLKAFLQQAPAVVGDAGGLFHGTRM